MDRIGSLSAAREAIAAIANYNVDHRSPPTHRDPVLPKRDVVRMVVLRPLYFAGWRVEPGEVVLVDGYDAPILIARGVARIE